MQNERTVLVVDDEEDIREMLIYDFRKAGFRTLEAKNGDEAFALVVSHPEVDAIVSDVRMPNGSGMDLLDQIRKIHAKLPVVLLITGFSDISPQEATRRGASGLLPKPINRTQMLKMIDEATA